MDSRKHIYYITVGNVQIVAEETIGRKLHKRELEKVISKLLDKIQWYDPLEEIISDEAI
jgi:hypothetical protein